MFDRRRKNSVTDLRISTCNGQIQCDKRAVIMKARLEVVHSYDGRLAQAFLMKNDEFWFVLLVTRNVFGKEKMAKILGATGITRRLYSPLLLKLRDVYLAWHHQSRPKQKRELSCKKRLIVISNDC